MGQQVTNAESQAHRRALHLQRHPVPNGARTQLSAKVWLCRDISRNRCSRWDKNSSASFPYRYFATSSDTRLFLHRPIVVTLSRHTIRATVGLHILSPQVAAVTSASTSCKGRATQPFSRKPSTPALKHRRSALEPHATAPEIGCLTESSLFLDRLIDWFHRISSCTQPQRPPGHSCHH